MQIQINTDNHIQGDERLEEYVTDVLEKTLGRFGGRITRLEVHLSDENAHKGGRDDKRCMIEARPAGLQPMAVTHQAEKLDMAIAGAADKLAAALDTALGRLQERR